MHLTVDHQFTYASTVTACVADHASPSLASGRLSNSPHLRYSGPECGPVAAGMIGLGIRQMEACLDDSKTMELCST
jgi:hypothetical protein